MLLKPRATVLNQKAVLYRRYTDIEKAYTVRTIYITTDGKKWMFDAVETSMVEYDGTATPAKTVTLYYADFLKYTKMTGESVYISYDVDKWIVSDTPFGSDPYVVGNAEWSDVGKYQKNNYFRVGAFDYVVTGVTDNDTTQSIRGAILPLQTLTIKYFCDDLTLRRDDLVELGGRLYAVESTSERKVYQPRPYRVYFATINSIL